MRPERICPTCGDPKNEDAEYCNMCIENGGDKDTDELDDLA